MTGILIKRGNWDIRTQKGRWNEETQEEDAIYYPRREAWHWSFLQSPQKEPPATPFQTSSQRTTTWSISIVNQPSLWYFVTTALADRCRGENSSPSSPQRRKDIKVETTFPRTVHIRGNFPFFPSILLQFWSWQDWEWGPWGGGWDLTQVFE